MDDALWMPVDCKTLDSWPGYKPHAPNLALSKYGGWLNGPRQTATGFFRVQKINNRWWAIDPEGYLYVHMALNSVKMDFNRTADAVYTLMRAYGFNGFGNWTWNFGPGEGKVEDGNFGRSIIRESTVKNTIPMAYTHNIGMIGSYRQARLPAGTPRIEMPVWDPGFEAKARDYAIAGIPDSRKNDPHLFGYMSDNELPFSGTLAAHLAITNLSDPNYLAAVNFLASRGKTPPVAPATLAVEDSEAYTALCGERYYKVVSEAIRAVDPNHMYMGSRCHAAERNIEAFMRNAGKYVDIFSTNHYHYWGDTRINTNQMSERLGRPLLFSEFWTNSIADGGGINGTGFEGRNRITQVNFYQNFVTTHLESGNLVGFHWFKYGTDVYNPDGSFDNVFTQSMKKMHTEVYDFIDYLDSRPAPDMALLPEADACLHGATNIGNSGSLSVKHASSPTSTSNQRTYMRFDVSKLGNQIESAKIVLRAVERGGNGYFRVELIENDSWGETTINGGNAPVGTTLIRTFSEGRSDLEIDVTSVIRQQVAGDGKLSVRIVGVPRSDGNISPYGPVYGSRENANPLARPVLEVYNRPVSPEADANFSGGANEGTQGTLRVKWPSDPSFSTNRQSYLRFNVSSLAVGTSPIDSATIVLSRLHTTPQAGNYRVELVPTDTWGETTINRSNAPAGTTVLKSFVDADHVNNQLEIDVTSVIGQAIASDGKLSIRIIGLDAGGSLSYASKENANTQLRPILFITRGKLKPEADANFSGGANEGTLGTLRVKFPSNPSLTTNRQSYLRFDLSTLAGVTSQIQSATIVLNRLHTTPQEGNYRVELVPTDTWGETTINKNNAPAGTTVLKSFVDAGHVNNQLQIDVTSVIGQAIASDGKLSIRIIGLDSLVGSLTYASKEHANWLLHPTLTIKMRPL